MSHVVLQISPEAKAAYFADYLHVAQQELRQMFGDVDVTLSQVGPLEFFRLPSADLDLKKLLRLSFAQGLYAPEGELLRPLETRADFRLHEDFVFGSKFKGKTNERLTQMLINVGLAAIGAAQSEGVKLLDPMCGRATTLLWAMRYGMQAWGVEPDPKAIEDVQRNIKKWTKLHRQKHSLSEAAFGGGKKKNGPRMLDFSAEGTTMRMVNGDARQVDQIYRKEKFDLLISDLPYGVQHLTVEKSRNPLSMLESCVEPWRSCLKKEGAVVLAFNRYLPSRVELISVFEKGGFKAAPFAAEHRMSESIVRDVVVLKLAN